MSRDSDSQARILKLSLDAAIGVKAQSTTAAVKMQDESKSESANSHDSKEYIQDAEKTDEIIQHGLKNIAKCGLYSCVNEDVCTRPVCKSGRGRGRTFIEKSNKPDRLQQKLQECTAATNCVSQPADNHSVSDPNVSAEGTESSQTAREVLAPTLAYSLDLPEECFGDNVSMGGDNVSMGGDNVSMGGDKHGISLKKQDSCDLPDLVMCQVTPEEITETTSTEELNSHLRKPAISDCPSSSQLEVNNNTTAEKETVACSDTISLGTQISNSCVRGEHSDGHVKKTLTTSAISCKEKQPPSWADVCRRTMAGRSFQAYNRSGRSQAISPLLKTPVNPSVTTKTSTYAKQTPLEKPTKAYGGKHRGPQNKYSYNMKQSQYQNTYSSEKVAVRSRVHDSKKQNADNKSNQPSKQLTFRPNSNLLNETVNAQDSGKVSKHEGKTCKVVQQTLTVDTALSGKVCTDPPCQEESVVKENHGGQNMMKQPDDVITLNLGIDKCKADVPEQVLETSGEFVGCDPSVHQMIIAIYQSYKRGAFRDDDRQPEILQEKNIDKKIPSEEASTKDQVKENTELLVSPAKKEISNRCKDLMSTALKKIEVLKCDGVEFIKDSSPQGMKASGDFECSLKSKTSRPQKMDCVELRVKTNETNTNIADNSVSSPLSKTHSLQSVHASNICSKSSSEFPFITRSQAGSPCEADVYVHSASSLMPPQDLPDEQNWPNSDSCCNNFPHLHTSMSDRLSAASHPSEHRAQSDSSRQSQNKQNNTSSFMPHFQPREFSLAAESIGSKAALERMVTFFKTCSADIQKYMSKRNEDSPLDVTIRINLMPPPSSDYVPRLAHHHYNQSHAEMLRPHCNASSSMFPYPWSVPYWYWGPWSEWYSPNMGTSMNYVPSNYSCYPGMMYPHPERYPPQADSDRKVPASSRAAPDYINPWMYSYWNPASFDNRQQGPGKAHAYTFDPSQTWQDYWTEEMAADLNNYSLQVGTNDGSRTQTYQTMTEAGKGDNGGLKASSGKLRESVISPEAQKCHRDDGADVNNSYALRDMRNENESPPVARPSQTVSERETKIRVEYLKRTSVSSFLSKELLQNYWSPRTPPAATHNFRNQHVAISPNVESPTLSLSSSCSLNEALDSELEGINNLSSRQVDVPSPNQVVHKRKAKSPAFVSKMTKTSVARHAKSGLLSCKQECPALDIEQLPRLREAHAKRRNSAPYQMTRLWECHQLGSSQEAIEVQSQQTQDIRRLSEPLLEGGDIVPASPSQVAETKKRVLILGDWARQFVARSRTYQYTFIDCHCHIDFLYSRLDIQRAPPFSEFRQENAQIFPHNYEGCVAVFCNPNTFTSNNPKDQILKSISTEDGIWLAVGCHPKNAVEFEDTHLTGLRQILKHPKVVALGEIGLDYSGSFGQHAEKQKQVFRQQLQLALEMRLPIVIHCRDADDDCLEILSQTVPCDYKIHAHCFTRDITVAMRWMIPFPNLYLGLTPIISYKSALEAVNTATYIPLDRLLLETDAPYFVPSSMRNGDIAYSHPGFALCTAEKVAEFKNIPVDEVLRVCRENTRKMYGI